MDFRNFLKQICFAVLVVFTFQSYNVPDTKEKKYKNIVNKYDRVFATDAQIRTAKTKYHNKYSNFLFTVKSDKHLVFVDRKNNVGDKLNYTFVFLNAKTLIEETKINAVLPTQISMLYASKKKIYYRKKLKVFEFDIASGQDRDISIENTKIFDLIPLGNDRFFCLGNVEDVNKSRHSFSFFTIDINSNCMTKIEKELSTKNEDESLENSLKYSGQFIKTDTHIVYPFDKYGKVMVFNDSGEFFKEIETIDKVKLAEITFFNGIYTYKRGSTFYANAAALINEDYIYVFSCRPSNLKYIMVDKYDLKKGSYTSSYKLDFNGRRSSDIRFLYQESENNFVLGFDNFYQAYTLQ
ncbi:hypothetical protein [Aquimarina algiphila]|uniref:hypothetical protein n=1 Tax=Aquimarina algiphila TaxID=2047982 RepID=UPI00232EECEC|nr:hypothetical protein [Aquimarina algiphila]